MRADNTFSALLRRYQDNPDLMSFGELVKVPEQIVLEKRRILGEDNERQYLKDLILAYAYFVALLVIIYDTPINFKYEDGTPSSSAAWIEELEAVCRSHADAKELENMLIFILASLIYPEIEREIDADQFHQVFSKLNSAELFIYQDSFPELKRAFNRLHHNTLCPPSVRTRSVVGGLGAVFGIASIVLTMLAFQLAMCALLATGVGCVLTAVVLITAAIVMQVPKKTIKPTSSMQSCCFWGRVVSDEKSVTPASSSPSMAII